MKKLKENKILKKILILMAIILSIYSIKYTSLADDVIETNNEVYKRWGSSEANMPARNISGSTGMFPQYYGSEKRTVTLPSARNSWTRQGSWEATASGEVVYCAEHGSYVRYGHYDPEKHFLVPGNTVIQGVNLNVKGTKVKTTYDVIMAVYNEYVQKIESTVRRHVGDETSDTSEPTKVDVTVNFDAPGGEDAIGYYIIWDIWDSYPEELKRILYLSGVYDMNRGDNQGAAMAQVESMDNLKELFEKLSKSVWPSKYSSDVDHGGYTEKGITATDGLEFVVLETAQGADDKYTKTGIGSYSNDEKAYILTSLENAYGETSEYGKKYSLNDMQTAYWLSLGQNPGEKGTANGRTLYENAQKYAEFVQQDFSASIDSSLAQVIADRKNQSYIVGPFSLDYPDYTAEDISYVKSLSINNGALLYDETHDDFEIIFESEGTQVPGANGMQKHYPKAGEKFFIKFDAKKINYEKKINLSAEFEYINGTNIDYTQLDTLADIYKYYGYCWIVDYPYIMESGGLQIYGTYEQMVPDTREVKSKWPMKDKEGKTMHDDKGNEIYETTIETYYKNEKVDIPTIDLQLCQPFIQQGEEPEQAGLSAQTLTIAENGKRTYNIESKDVDIDLSMELGGYAWEDAKGGKESTSNGTYESSEKRIPNMLVTLYQAGGGEVASTRTDENGEYIFKNLNAMYQYSVKFTYNGQYYQPVNFEDSSTWGGSNWQTNSNAKDVTSERKEYNIRFEQIGSAPANYKTKDGTYQGVGVRGYNKSYTKEELLAAGVIDEFGNLIGGNESMAQYVEDCMMDAYTTADGAAGLYPTPEIFLIDKQYKWLNTPKLLASNGIAGIAILYPNAYYINLGVERREESDLAIKKDVDKVTLEINGQTHTYTYDTLENKENAENQWDISVRLSDAYYNTKYSRELYKEDYIYKASMYGERTEELGKTKEDELEVYITYKIMVRNQAMSIQAKVDEIVDYYDKDLEYVDNRSYIEIKRGENKGKYAAKASQTSRYEQISSSTKTEIEGYDNLYVTGLDDKYLTAGQTAYVYLTFKVKKDAADGEDWVRLDEVVETGAPIGVGKENIVEINGYSTRYAPGTTVPNIGDVSLEAAGIIDRDSNPGNLKPTDVPKDGNITYENFEDDTDKAPNMRIILYREDDKTRVISGTVWEDERNQTLELTSIGDGQKTDDETLINGVTVQLVEIMKNGKEYVWREFGSKGHTLEEYQQLTEEQKKKGLGAGAGTGSGTKETETPIINYKNLIPDYKFTAEHDGQYAFKSFMPGKYVVRFIYGDTVKTVLPSSLGGLNAKSYNGQDYKSTTYQAGVEQKGKYIWREKSTWNVGEEVLGKVLTEVSAYDKETSDHNERVSVPTVDANNNLDVTKQNGYYYNIAESDKLKNVSDAKDIWSRRSQVIDYSSNSVTNYIAEVLASHKVDYNVMNDRNTLVKDLIEKTNMTAETGLMVIELEYNQSGSDGNKKDNTYQITNVDLGLEERPKAGLAINKEVTNVKLTLADSSVLFDAKNTTQNVLWRKHETYKTGYDSKTHRLDDKKFTNLANIRELNKNKIGLIQLSMDEELMHGATIRITYKLTVTNIGEVDYKDDCFYYTGKVKDTSTIVKTKADQVIDYVPNNLQFNAEENSNWSVIQKDELNTKNMYTTLVNNNLRKEVEKYNTVIQTGALGKELVPVIASKEESSVEVPLVLTQLITSENKEDDLTYSNVVEIVKTSNTVGRRNEYSVVGNQDPSKLPQELDSDKAEVIKILPPFGNIQNYIAIGLIISGTLGLVILAIIFIRKRVINK
jgi:hypothetical protein